MIKGLFFGHTMRSASVCAGCLKGRIWDFSRLVLTHTHSSISAAAGNFAENGIRRDAVGKVWEKFLSFTWLSHRKGCDSIKV